MPKREKLVLEFPINSSPQVLFDHISTASGLSQWFADDVNVRQKIYTFYWDGDSQEAELLKRVNGKYIRFKWVDSHDEEYFELEVAKDDLTGDISLLITDFTNEEDADETELLWESQVHDLKSLLGVG